MLSAFDDGADILLMIKNQHNHTIASIHLLLFSILYTVYCSIFIILLQQYYTVIAIYEHNLKKLSSDKTVISQK